MTTKHPPRHRDKETLTTQSIKAAKPRAVGYYVQDALVRGLALRVAPTGEKTWSVRYRIHRTQRRLTIGGLSEFSLADARASAKAARKSVDNGIDPAEVKQTRHDAPTVSEYAQTYLTEHAEVKKKSWKTDRRYLKNEIVRHWEHKLMRDITKADVRALLAGIVKRDAPITANRVRSVLHKMFKLAEADDVVDHNPVTAVAKPGTEHAADHVLTAAEIKKFWTATEAIEAPMAAFYQLRLITAQRGGEVMNMEWSHVDLEGAWWTVPKGATKNKLSHRVPLSVPAVRIIAALLATASEKAVYVLENARGKRQQAVGAATFGIKNFKAHDLRRTAATSMASAGVPRLVIGMVLNHVQPGVTSVYDRHSYDAQKREALDAWAVALAAITDPQNRP